MFRYIYVYVHLPFLLLLGILFTKQTINPRAAAAAAHDRSMREILFCAAPPLSHCVLASNCRLCRRHFHQPLIDCCLRTFINIILCGFCFYNNAWFGFDDGREGEGVGWEERGHV